MSDIQIILPYYIYHYIDISTSTYLGLITTSQYDLSPTLFRGWKLYGIFYAFNPKIKPIPDSTKIFTLKIKNYYPYDILSYNYIYDIYLLDTDDKYSINFITYNRAVPNTKELYFHELNGSIFPSFDKNPPSKSNGWVLPDLNPIYVMTSNNHKFICDNGKCIPSPVSINNLQTPYESLNIDECLKKCNKTLNILQLIKKIDENQSLKENKINKLNFQNNFYT